MNVKLEKIYEQWLYDNEKPSKYSTLKCMKDAYILALSDIEKRVKEKYIEDFKTLDNIENDSRDGYFIIGFINSAIKELKKENE
jgi:hypothetical protein